MRCTITLIHHNTTLSISNLTFGYKRRHNVLADFSLDLPAGGVYGLLGPNGAGKSTLLYLIAGLLTPTKGTVTYNGVNTRLRMPSTLNDIFLVSEEFSLPSVTLKEYVNLNAPFYPRFSADDLQKNLDMFGLTGDIRLNALSMGQKKKVFMSFALACNTSLLLMDEPTNGLDIPGKSAFRRCISSGMTDDRTIVISTHQVRDIDRLLDHIVIMNMQHPVLNSSVSDIQDKLAFAVTNDKEVIANALISQRDINGCAVMLPNLTGIPTDINLELLFNFALEKPGELLKLFNTTTENR